MTDDITELDLTQWYSTYGILTAKSIFERFEIMLTERELATVTHNKTSAYYQLLQVPLRNVFNGIIMEQAHDYQVYAQKQFIDYLLSGEAAKDENSPGAPIRQDLEQTRVQLLEIGENFNQQEMAHQTLIADSQTELIEVALQLVKSMSIATKQTKRILQAAGLQFDETLLEESIRILLNQFEVIHEENLSVTSVYWEMMAKVLKININHKTRAQLAEILLTIADPRPRLKGISSQYLPQTEDMGISMRSFRSQFYGIILKTNELLKLLPEYVVDKVKEEENRESLYFDAHIGGE